MGTGDVEALGTRARQLLTSAPNVVVTHRNHPVSRWLAAGSQRTVAVRSLSDLSASISSERAIAAVLDEVRQGNELVLAAPGNPLREDHFSRSLAKDASGSGVSVGVIPAMGYFDAATASDLLSSPFDDIQIVGSSKINPRSSVGTVVSDVYAGVYRPIDPTRPLFLGPLFADEELIRAKAWLGLEYPADHPLVVSTFPGDGSNQRSAALTVESLVWDETAFALSLLVRPVDRLRDLTSFDTLRYIVGRLRAPDGCPWDREQDYRTIKKHLIEETYEAIGALDDEEYGRFAEELGDVILQVVMYAQFGREAGDFTLETVLRAVNEKMIRRHPHVFGDVALPTSADVLRNWETIKRREKPGSASTFDGIPESAPALMRAEAVQSRASRYGWSADLVESVVSNTVGAPDRDTRAWQFGNVLFDLVASARTDKIDPEEALRLAINRFQARVERVLADAHLEGIAFDSLTRDEKRRRLLQAADELSAERSAGANIVRSSNDSPNSQGNLQ
jgi:tetrapyrrole methylase family protein/MazG family protein